jgi:hypothetical protein
LRDDNDLLTERYLTLTVNREVATSIVADPSLDLGFESAQVAREQ